jgi:hypothetical protein
VCRITIGSCLRSRRSCLLCEKWISGEMIFGGDIAIRGSSRAYPCDSQLFVYSL